MPDPVVEFFTEKEWYDQDEISMNKRLAVREFYEWLQSRPTKRAADFASRCPKCNAVAGWHHEACEDYTPEPQSH